MRLGYSEEKSLIKMDMEEAVSLLRLEQSVKSQATMLIQTIKHIICNADDHLDNDYSSLKL